jgi:hypothetical protein
VSLLLLFLRKQRGEVAEISIFFKKTTANARTHRHRYGCFPSVYELFAEKHYADLPGGILENFGRLFKNDLKIYVYPLQRPKDELRVIDFHHCDFTSDLPAANSKRAGGNR